MSLLDILTGGEDSTAAGDLQNAANYINGINVPTAQSLQLSPLAQYYVSQGMTPAQAQAATAGPSAYNNAQVSPAGMEAMQSALAQFQNVASSNGMTPQEQAQIAQAEEAMNTNTAGQRGAIAQDFAQKGVPASLVSAALQNGTVGQNAQQGYNSALQGQASAANNALTALSNVGQLGGQIQSANTGWASQVANAQNALNQFNAGNVQQTNLANQTAQQQANAYNAQTSQQVANANVGGQQQVQYQNEVQAPETAYTNALQKGSELAGIAGQQSNQAMSAGQQNAGLFGGVLGAAATLGAGALMGPAGVTGTLQGLPAGADVSSPSYMSNAGNVGAETLGGPQPLADGGYIKPTIPSTMFSNGGPAAVPPGGLNFKKGGPVPGHALVPGNSRVNDVVPARLSPGEYVMNREQVAKNPGLVQHLMAEKKAQQAPSAHPSDIASVLKALASLRGTI
jgi:hypothetical protein